MIYLNEITEAINNFNKVNVTFKAKKYGNLPITRTCAPMDYSIGKNFKNSEKGYHFWDFQGPNNQHNLSLLETEIISIEPESAPNFDYIPYIINEYYPKNYTYTPLLGEQLKQYHKQKFCERPLYEQQRTKQVHELFPR